MTKAQTYINWILGEIRNGKIHRKHVIHNFLKKFKVTDRTFDIYWKTAQEEYQNELDAIEKEKSTLYKDAALDAVKRDIMQKNEMLEILTTIARGKARKYGDSLIYPSDSERRSAIETLAKMTGVLEDFDKDVTITLNFPDEFANLESDKF